MSTDLAKTIGELIRQKRKQQGLTQRQVSEKLGYGTTQFLSNIECGSHAAPTEVLGKLVLILGLPELKIKQALLREYENKLSLEIEQGKKKYTDRRLNL